MNAHLLRNVAAGTALAAALVVPTLASAAPAANAPGATVWLLAVNDGAPLGASYWHRNMPESNGELMGVSPVAAKIRFGDGTSQVFSVSRGQYEQLRNEIGETISFTVRHGALRGIGY